MTSSPPKSEASLASSLRSSWRVFLDTYEPLRSNLYRYCRHLTHSPWDAEDLAQDTMARAFVTLGQLAPQYGPEAARRTVLYGMLFGSARLARGEDCGVEPHFVQQVLPAPPRAEAVFHRGRWLVLHWYQHQDEEAVRAVTRVDFEGERVAHLFNYFFNPDFIAEVCGELGVPWRSNGYRWFFPRE